LEQLHSFGDEDRDPRTRVITVAYFALINPKQFELHLSYESAEVKWFSINEIPKLAFDHQKIYEKALDRLKSKIHREPIGFELLPDKFTIDQIQTIYETIWNTKLDRRNFRKKMLSLGILIDLNEKQADVDHRPGQLYKFDVKTYKKLQKESFNLGF